MLFEYNYGNGVKMVSIKTAWTMCQPSSTASLRYSLYPTSGHFAVYFKLSGKIKKFSDIQIIFKSSIGNVNDSCTVRHEISLIALLD